MVPMVSQIADSVQEQGRVQLSAFSDQLESHLAASLAWYVRIMSAPARLMLNKISIVTRRSSIQPFRAAAFTIANSPLTL